MAIIVLPSLDGFCGIFRKRDMEIYHLPIDAGAELQKAFLFIVGQVLHPVSSSSHYYSYF
jgi:hypothetical protein